GATDRTPAYTRKTSSSFTELFHRRLEQRLVDERWKFILDVGTVRNQLNHQYDDETRVGIDAVHRPVRAAPPERSDRVESIRAVPIGRLEAETEAESGRRMQRSDLVRGHQMHGARRQDANAVQRAAAS